MEGKKTKPHALLIFGAPCSGKTTFSEKFASKYHLAFFNLDTIMEENGFSRKNMLTILELIARTQQNVLIEGGLKTEKERGEIKHILRMAGYDVSLVWIQTDIATIRSRLKARFKTVREAKEFYEKEVATIEAPNDLESPIILSGKHTFETQSKHVLSGLADVN